MIIEAIPAGGGSGWQLDLPQFSGTDFASLFVRITYFEIKAPF